MQIITSICTLGCAINLPWCVSFRAHMRNCCVAIDQYMCVHTKLFNEEHKIWSEHVVFRASTRYQIPRKWITARLNCTVCNRINALSNVDVDYHQCRCTRTFSYFFTNYNFFNHVYCRDVSEREREKSLSFNSDFEWESRHQSIISKYNSL